MAEVLYHDYVLLHEVVSVLKAIAGYQKWTNFREYIEIVARAAGVEVAPPPRQRTVALKVDEELLERLEEYARRRGISRSELIRRAIEEYLKQEGWL